MVFIRKKIINGHPYLYMQKSVRIGGKVVSKHVKYVGKATNVSLGTTFDDLPIHKPGTPQTEDFKANVKEPEIIRENIDKAVRLDKRTDKEIADDIYRKAKKVHKTDAKSWSKHKKGSDLYGWDTPHMKHHRKNYKITFKKTIKKLKHLFPNNRVEGRVKKVFSMIGKVRKRNLKKKGFTYFDLTDIGGFRITFENNKEIYRAVSKLKVKFKIIEIEDYIKNPKFGYRSYHMLVNIRGKLVEIQLRTPNQTKWADWTHEKFYKNIKELKRKIGEKNYNSFYKYSLKLAEHYAKLDDNKSSIKPKKPKIGKNILKNIPMYERKMDKTITNKDNVYGTVGGEYYKRIVTQVGNDKIGYKLVHGWEKIRVVSWEHHRVKTLFN